jgi:hypothetical protein
MIWRKCVILDDLGEYVVLDDLGEYVVSDDLGVIFR